VRRARDAGSVAVFFSILAAGWVAMLMLVIVGGGRVRAYQRADNIAAEAARTAGQAIQLGPAVQGGPKQIDPDRARQAAEAYFAAVGATGTVTIEGDRVLRVSATIGYDNPSGIPYLGGDTWFATGSATAVLLIE
jgi:hypothetical protein